MDSVIVLDFGGQYAHLITRRIRDLGVYSEILPYDVDLDKIRKITPKAIILSGGPGSIYEKDSPTISNEFFQFTFENKIPILGICYGHHLIIHKHEGEVESKEIKEYGKANAGNFILVRINEKGERFPLTIANYNRQKGTITLV
ncbi:unnamed protein product, partial [marine sediment metagenome]